MYSEMVREHSSVCYRLVKDGNGVREVGLLAGSLISESSISAAVNSAILDFRDERRNTQCR